jgi:saccharopine dehydrogenase-like NADP-dependent oxidoreductase
VGARAADLADAGEVSRALREADVAVVAVPGFLGAAVLEAVLRSGKPVVDISFSPEDPFDLDETARARGVSAVVDCGVAPGLSNLLVGRSAAELDRTDDVLILVGGLPRRRLWPWEYRAVFSPTDVLEEYTRPSRFRLHGVEVVRPALSDPELVDLPGVGTLEAFNTDGLRTLLRTIVAPTLREKTLRYPGHAERLRFLRETGFLSTEPVDVAGTQVVPRSLAEALVFPAWKLPEDEDEFTVMRIVVSGIRAGTPTAITWDLLDGTDAVTRDTSMARTTGFPCALVARMLADGSWREPGVHPPEILGRDAGVTRRILDGLAARGVVVRRSEVAGR